MTTVHLVGNAHLDPVWLWRWPAGVIEALSTCRTAADLLDRYPQFLFTRSDAWLYEQIERYDAELFSRIVSHARSGRWRIVGGWYIQPDCNFPRAESFRMHAKLGKAYFAEKFGVDVTVGYNVDSFGHNAMIPRFLCDAGYDSYVMMRPMQHEKTLPSPLFRWRSPDGSEVAVWRIVGSYATKRDDLLDHIRMALDASDPNIGHVMCFYGVGDHGGGPTEGQIRWILEHRDAVPGATLVFSHPRAFFDAVAPNLNRMPVVCDELQMHAIGCYSVLRDVKTHMRRAEHRLAAAGEMAELQSAHAGGVQLALDGAWKEVLFNQFHDILAGTSIADAYEDARDQLGQAVVTADRIIHDTLFRQLADLPSDRNQQIVVFNPSGHRFAGCLAHEPWTGGKPFSGRLVDAGNRGIPYQIVQQPSIVGEKKMLIWCTEMSPHAMAVYRLRTDAAPAEYDGELSAGDSRISNSYWSIQAGGDGTLLTTQAPSHDHAFAAEGLQVVVLEDLSDTWSHGKSGFGGPMLGRFQVSRVVVEESGPVRASMRIEAEYDRSRLTLHARLFCGSPCIEIELRLAWLQHLQLAKLLLPFSAGEIERTDGIPGGQLKRPQNGQEYPIVDWTMVETGTSAVRPFGVVCPDCWSLDGSASDLRLTLCRSPVYAWHDPAVLNPTASYRYTDQGEHTFRFALVPDASPHSSHFCDGPPT